MPRVLCSSRRIASAVEFALAEMLEPRRLFAAIESGILVARGTANADTISLRRTGTDDVVVTTNGANQTFDMDDFTGVRLEGLGGNDTFNMVDPLTSPVVRQVTVSGGAGNDTVDYSARSASLTFIGFQQPDSVTPVPFAVVSAGAQADRVDFTVERFIGGSAADTFTMGGTFIDREDEPALVLEGRGGNDLFNHVPDLDVTMFGGAGNDRFEVDAEAAQFRAIYGGEGDDVIALDNEGLPNFLDAGGGTDTITLGGSHRDVIDMRLYPGLENVEGAGSQGGLVTIIGNELNNLIRTDEGFDAEAGVTLIGNGGNDTLVGGVGRDLLQGGGGDDLILGRGDNDSLDGGSGNDSISGDEGDDALDGGAGTDTMDGGIGNDTLVNGEVTPPAGQVRIINGILTADGSWGGEEIRIRRVGSDDVEVSIDNLVRTFDMDDFTGILLRGNNGYDFIDIVGSITVGTLTRKVTLEGGNGNDTLFGENGDDVLRGGAGNDVLFGEGGNDALFGEAGEDTDISGGPGRDFIDGGDGNDAYLESQDGEVDTVLGGAGYDIGAVDAIDQRSGLEEEDVAV